MAHAAALLRGIRTLVVTRVLQRIAALTVGRRRAAEAGCQMRVLVLVLAAR